MKRGEPALIGFPKGFSYGFGSAALEINDAINSHSKKGGDVSLNKTHSMANKIVMVIDESIDFKEFDALVNKSNPSVINYGIAYIGANCSAASNYILRKAAWVRKPDGSNSIFELESLFALAKKADFKTAYLDNQNVLKDPTVKNYFDKKEISNIDVIEPASQKAYDQDTHSLNDISQLLKANSKVFIIVNKIGAHFPYENVIPPEDVTPNKIDNYRKAISRNSIDFINALDKLVDQDTIVFYTSDHGQNLYGRTTHCNVGNDVDPIEYSVPMLVMTKNTEIFNQLNTNKNHLANKLTHIELSESIRNALGYSLSELDSIFSTPKHLDGKFCGLYGPPKAIFGEKPKCVLLN
jgi:hypothetical protein